MCMAVIAVPVPTTLQTASSAWSFTEVLTELCCLAAVRLNWNFSSWVLLDDNESTFCRSVCAHWICGRSCNKQSKIPFFHTPGNHLGSGPFHRADRQDWVMLHGGKHNSRVKNGLLQLWACWHTSLYESDLVQPRNSELLRRRLGPWQFQPQFKQSSRSQQMQGLFLATILVCWLLYAISLGDGSFFTMLCKLWGWL